MTSSHKGSGKCCGGAHGHHRVVPVKQEGGMKFNKVVVIVIVIAIVGLLAYLVYNSNQKKVTLEVPTVSVAVK